MDLKLKNRIVLVTAASQGLGYATALEFAREGAQVAICSRDKVHIDAASDAIFEETGVRVLGIQANIRVPEDINHAYDRIIEEFGGLDILVTNSGGPPSSAFEETDDGMWSHAFESLLMAPVRLIRAGLPLLRQSTAPAVLTITSISVKQPEPNLVLSNSVRMSVIGLTKTLALELGREGIRFNSILPSWTETERIHDLLEDRSRRAGTSVEEEASKQSANSPLNRMATPLEFAQSAVFICSPIASYLNGVMLSVDGGTYKGIF